MTWPPPPLKSDYVNADVMDTAHPAAHNDVSLTLQNDFQPQIAANITNIAANASDIAAHNAIYGPTGIITAPDPQVRSDTNIERRNAAGTLYSYIDGIRSPGSGSDYAQGFLTPGGGYLLTNAEYDLDVSDVTAGFYCLVTARCYITVQPGASGNVSFGVGLDGGAVTRAGSDACRGNFRVSGSGTHQEFLNVVTVPEAVFIDPAGVSTVKFEAMAQQVDGGSSDCSLADQTITVVPFWR